MIFFALQLLGFITVSIIHLIPFHDAAEAINEGVFSFTSTTGYSIARSLMSYSVYLLIMVCGAGIVAYIHKKNNTKLVLLKEKESVYHKITKNEWIIVIATIGVFSILALFFRERIFDQSTLHSEEFYNLSALLELKNGHFDIIYPYSIGNLIMLNLFSSLGLNLIGYKIILNTLALICGYWAISMIVKKIRTRMITFFGFLVFFVQPLISPSLHRNFLRFLLPALIPIVLEYLINRMHIKSAYRVVLLVLCNIGILFFSSADVLVIGYTIYVLYLGIAWYERRRINDLVPFLYTPLVAIMFMSILTGFQYFYILKNQISSIFFYSGYANTTPYFNIFDISLSHGLGTLMKMCAYCLIYYLPIIALGSILIFIVLSYRKEHLMYTPYRLLIGLAISYALYFRQNFGDAGIGRIGIASTVLVFIVLLLLHFRGRATKNIVRVSSVFFTLIMISSLHSFYYVARDLSTNYEKQKKHEGLVLCADTFVGEKLKFAGFEWCDEKLVSDLEKLNQQVNGRQIYIYDDTFSLYYILNSRPIVLIPAYYMAYSKEYILVERMKALSTNIMIYSKELHFFGVPEPYLTDTRFMRVINEYRQQEFRAATDTEKYVIYQK